MLVDPTQLPFVTIFFGVVTFILVMSLPAFLELKKSRDPKPRRSEESFASRKYEVQLTSIERSEEIETDMDLMKKMSNVLSALPNLEA
jgi:hypothetical protein